MTSRLNILIFSLLCIAVMPLKAQRSLKANARLLKTVSQSQRESAAQYKLLMKQLPPDRFPVTWYEQNKKLVTSGSEPWVGGFYPGALLYLYEGTGDTAMYNEAMRKL